MAYNTIPVLSTVTLIVGSNTARKSLIISNTSAARTIYFGPDDAITGSNTTPLLPNQSLFINKLDDGWLGPVYGISPAGTVDVRYWETIQ